MTNNELLKCLTIFFLDKTKLCCWFDFIINSQLN